MEKREARRGRVGCCSRLPARRVWLAGCASKGGFWYYSCSNIEVGDFVLFTLVLGGSSDALLRGASMAVRGQVAWNDAPFWGHVYYLQSFGFPLQFRRATEGYFEGCRSLLQPSSDPLHVKSCFTHAGFNARFVVTVIACDKMRRKFEHASSAAPVIWDELIWLWAAPGLGLDLHFWTSLLTSLRESVHLAIQSRINFQHYHMHSVTPVQVLKCCFKSSHCRTRQQDLESNAILHCYAAFPLFTATLSIFKDSSAASHTAVKRSQTTCYRRADVSGTTVLSANGRLHLPCHSQLPPLVASSLVSSRPHPLNHLEMFLRPLAPNVSVSQECQSQGQD